MFKIFLLFLVIFFPLRAYANTLDVPIYNPPATGDLSDTTNTKEKIRNALEETIQEEQKYGGKDKLQILKNLKTVLESLDSGEPPILTPVGSFNGKLSQVSPVKLVYGLGTPEFLRFQATMGNVLRAEEYLNKHHIKYSIEVVVYDLAVKFFDLRNGFEVRTDSSTDGKNVVKKYLDSLKNDKHVKIVLCRNAMTIFGMVRHDIPKWVGVVPMASLEIYEKEKHGYVYLSN